MSVNGILYLKEGATSPGIAVIVPEGFLPLSQWDSIVANFSFEGGGPTIQRTAVTVVESATEATLSITFADGQVTAGRGKMELVFTSASLTRILPEDADFIPIKVTVRV